MPPKHDNRCFVYVLGSWRENKVRTYVGWTTSIQRRLQQHNAGSGAKSTRGRQWVLLYFEKCNSRSEAMTREWHLKRDRKLRDTLREAMKAQPTASSSALIPKLIGDP